MQMMPIEGYRQILSVWFILGFSFLSLSVQAETEDVQSLVGEPLHIRLVETTIRYDFFNQRCRGVRASVNQSEVNRLFIQKYRLTLNNFIKQYITKDARAYRDQLEESLYRQVAEMGGCQPARDQGLETRIKSDYRTLMERVETSSWYPAIIN